LKYRVPKRSFCPTFQFGGFVYSFFGTEYQRDLEVHFVWGALDYTERHTYNILSKFDMGLFLGLGLQKILKNQKELFFDLNYQRGLGIFPDLNTNTLTLNIGYQLSK
jgi:hypothetical protein